MNLFKRIKEDFEMQYKIKNFIYAPFEYINSFFVKIKRASTYFVFGWNNPDWDYVFLYEEILFKLKRMKKFFDEEGNGVSTKNNKQLSLCINLLERIIKDQNYSVNCDKHEIKWGQEGFYVCKNGYLKSQLENYLSKEQVEKKRKEFLAAVKEDDKHKEQDINLLFDTIKKHSQRWWD